MSNESHDIERGDNDERHKKSIKSVDENSKGRISNSIVLFVSYLSPLDKRKRKKKMKKRLHAKQMQ